MNVWYKILWRKAYNQMRRLYLKINRKRYRELLDMKRPLAAKDKLTFEDRKRLAAINCLLGWGCVYVSKHDDITLQRVKEIIKNL